MLPNVSNSLYYIKRQRDVRFELEIGKTIKWSKEKGQQFELEIGQKKAIVKRKRTTV